MPQLTGSWSSYSQMATNQVALSNIGNMLDGSSSTWTTATLVDNASHGYRFYNWSQRTNLPAEATITNIRIEIYAYRILNSGSSGWIAPYCKFSPNGWTYYLGPTTISSSTASTKYKSGTASSWGTTEATAYTCLTSTSSSSGIDLYFDNYL